MTPMQTTFMSDEDLAAVEYAKRIKKPMPRYAFKGVDHLDQPYEYDAFFTPIQFRPITALGYPECATVANCAHLVQIWTKSNPRGVYTLIEPAVIE